MVEDIIPKSRLFQSNWTTMEKAQDFIHDHEAASGCSLQDNRGDIGHGYIVEQHHAKL